METTNTKPAKSARCQCYHKHNSASGRCQVRNVTDPTRHEGQAAICEECRTWCPAGCGVRDVIKTASGVEA